MTSGRRSRASRAAWSNFSCVPVLASALAVRIGAAAAISRGSENAKATSRAPWRVGWIKKLSPATGTPPTAIEDDLPLLTEVVSAEETVTEARPDRIDETLLAVIAADLVHTLQQQIAIELPTLIEASLLSAQDELRNGINSTLELALQNFLARRQQLRLPFDDPDVERY